MAWLHPVFCNANLQGSKAHPCLPQPGALGVRVEAWITSPIIHSQVMLNDGGAPAGQGQDSPSSPAGLIPPQAPMAGDDGLWKGLEKATPPPHKGGRRIPAPPAARPCSWPCWSSLRGASRRQGNRSFYGRGLGGVEESHTPRPLLHVSWEVSLPPPLRLFLQSGVMLKEEWSQLWKVGGGEASAFWKLPRE